MKLYFKYLRIYILSIAQYKISIILTIFGQFLSVFFGFLSIKFLFNNFYQIGTFSYDEILFFYANITITFSLAEFFGRGFDLFSYILSSGKFDRILLRPCNEIIQILGSTFEISRVGKLIQSIFIYVWVILKGKIYWSFFNIFVQILIIVFGVQMFISLFIINAALCFFTTEGLEIFNIFTDGSREFGKYPMTIYGNKIFKIFTYIIPVACIQYYPISFLTRKSTEISYGLAPLYSIILLIPALLIWKFGEKKYTSTGS